MQGPIRKTNASSSWTSDQPSGIACCSSKQDSRFLRSTATRACEPSGAALRYWTGHETGCPRWPVAVSSLLADAAGGVGVLPLDGPGVGGVGVDVAAELAS